MKNPKEMTREEYKEYSKKLHEEWHKQELKKYGRILEPCERYEEYCVHSTMSKEEAEEYCKKFHI